MHSTHRVMSVVGAALCAAGLLTGCAKAPDQELAAAKAALQAAQAAEADKYLPERYGHAAKALEAAQAEIDKQNAASPLSRKYSGAKRLLEIATPLATALPGEVAGAKDAMKAEVEADLPAAQAALKETLAEVKKAPKSVGKEAVAAMKANVTEAEAALTQAAAEISAGNYFGARGKIGDARAKLRKVSDRLSTGGGSLM